MERKWWCFLLSSIFTFLLGLLSVILTRLAQAYLYADSLKRGLHPAVAIRSVPHPGTAFKASISAL